MGLHWLVPWKSQTERYHQTCLNPIGTPNSEELLICGEEVETRNSRAIRLITTAHTAGETMLAAATRCVVPYAVLPNNLIQQIIVYVMGPGASS